MHRLSTLGCAAHLTRLTANMPPVNGVKFFAVAKQQPLGPRTLNAFSSSENATSSQHQSSQSLFSQDGPLSCSPPRSFHREPIIALTSTTQHLLSGCPRPNVRDNHPRCSKPASSAVLQHLAPPASNPTCRCARLLARHESTSCSLHGE